MKRDWLQIVTNLAIVVGLVALLYELNQNHLHNRTQLVATSFEFWNTRLISQMGDNPSPTISKYLNNPDDLTDEEMPIVYGFLGTVFLEREYSAKMAGLGTMDPTGTMGTDALARLYLTNCISLEWWDTYKFDFPGILPIIEPEVANLRTSCTND